MNQLQERIQPEAALPTPHVSRQERQEELRRQLKALKEWSRIHFRRWAYLAHDAVAGNRAVGPITFLGVAAALGLALTAEAGDFEAILAKVEEAVVAAGGADRFGTWAYSYGYTTSAGLAQHAMNVLNGESDLEDIDDIAKAYEVFSPGAEWNGSSYTNATTGVKSDNTFLVYQDTYIMGDPGHYMGSTQVEVPEKYFTIA